VISLAPYVPADESAIRAFNARLAAADTGFQFPPTLESLAIPANPGAPLWTELWVARDGERVCGGFILKHERLLLANAELAVGNYQLPVSEGIIDRRYATVGIKLTQQVLALQPALYSLGMGSTARPLPRPLARLGWTVEEVPFSSASCTAVLVWRLAARVATLPARWRAGLELEPVTGFDERVDALIAATRADYAAVLERRSAALNIRFPAHDARLRRFVLTQRGRLVGWLVLTDHQLKAHKQFGDMRLGCIVDGLIEPQLLVAALGLAARALVRAGVDLIVSNQSHAAWQRALGRGLFARGPSNFVLARSPAFANGVPLGRLHMNRGDGDGPINL